MHWHGEKLPQSPEAADVYCLMVEWEWTELVLLVLVEKTHSLVGKHDSV
jgi:hypothetical protein